MYVQKLTRKEYNALSDEQKLERSRAQKRIENKKYQTANKERLADYRKEYGVIYREANKDKIAARMKIYCESNKVKHNERAKEWNKNNKELIKARKQAKITHYVVYKHTNSTGSVYIGAEENTRAYQFHRR